MKKKTAIIFGSTGQDGTFMTNLLLKKNYRVIALSQSNKFTSIKNIKNKNLIKKKINYYESKSVQNIIRNNKCSEIYFFAGQSSPSISFKNYQETFKSHFLPVYLILQSILEFDRKIKFFNTASSEIFKKSSKRLNENSQKEPNNPYGLVKYNTFLLVKYYRDNFNLKCFSGILFNHESELRPKNYVIPKIFHYLKTKTKTNKKLLMGNLNVIKDFGWAEEFIEIIHKIMMKKIISDYVIATGKSVKLKDLVIMIFKSYNLNWKNHVKISKKFKRIGENQNVYADISKLKNMKISPKIFISEIILKLKKDK